MNTLRQQIDHETKKNMRQYNIPWGKARRLAIQAIKRHNKKMRKEKYAKKRETVQQEREDTPNVPVSGGCIGQDGGVP